MSFQHFRIQPIPQQSVGQPVNQPGSSVSPSSLSQALGHTHPTGPAPTIVQGFHLESLSNGVKKGPYGSGDIDDGYTLVFDSMEAFQAWRRKEEEEKMVEFVKGDTHGSKAVPPRFKDHTKLVCARHSRSGRKKYVKKFPERVRKVPSRKLEGVGCPASISYKTYFDSDEVRACYMSEHSHEIGIANLPFTKKGRKAQAEHSTRARGYLPPQPGADDTDQSTTPPAVSAHLHAVAGPSNAVPQRHSMSSQSSTPLQTSAHPRPAAQLQHPQFQQAVSMPAPLPPPPPPAQVDVSQERWDRMAVLFQSIRDRARGFEYPGPSVAALESVLVRLYLESPMVGGMGGVGQQPMGGLHMNGMGDAGS